jgi:predicted DCC family thiol-disulfide oxidoreductase YuxK/uncharacterized membrane protein YphA (DoxX/SURF4 family)
MLFDGDCHFCRRWVVRWQRATGETVHYLPLQDKNVGENYPEIPRAELEEAIHLILPDGSVSRGAEGVFQALALAGKERWIYWLYRKVPIFADITELLYHEVSTHRTFLSKLDQIYSGPGDLPLSYVRVRYVFLRGLALIYLIAFTSLFGQIKGLVGSHGIAPAHSMMEALKADAAQNHIGLEKYHLFPTLAWWSATDHALCWQCGAGIGLSVLLLLGIVPAPVLFLLWILYLSLSTVCVPFLDFQWDNLLLETGFLAILFAPLQWFERPSRQSPASPLALWLLRWLIFRLMLESGCVKLMSGDISWWNLSALRVHYETQPLPTWIAWYAHQLPASAQAACTFLLLAVEVICPVLIFAGRRARLVAAALFMLLQGLIMLTGNYTFFNWLTILLCIPLLDDRILRRPSAVEVAHSRRWPRWVTLPIAVVIFVVTFIQLIGTFRIAQRWPAPVIAVYRWVAPFRTLNSYGLFAFMTQKRNEIIVEGSNDGQHWVDYEFKYKPGDLKKRPGFVAPNQPRLDWQMWFAALKPIQDPENRWFLNFELRLLQNSSDVLALLGRDPFPNGAPKYVRALLYEYHFTDMATRRATGQWWKREYRGIYCPAFSLEDIHPKALTDGAGRVD